MNIQLEVIRQSYMFFMDNIQVYNISKNQDYDKRDDKLYISDPKWYNINNTYISRQDTKILLSLETLGFIVNNFDKIQSKKQ